MLLHRVQNCLIVLAGALSPLCVALALAYARMAAEARPATQIGPPTPNPIKAPASMMGPQSWIVNLDPYFAGTAVPWLLAGIVLLTIALVAVAIFWPTETTAQKGRRLWLLAGVSLLFGLAFAGPLFYALVASFRNPILA